MSDLPLPTQYYNDPHTVNEAIRIDDADIIHGLVDSDWDEDSHHWQSITVVIIKYVIGTLYFKTKFQETITMSCIEAEFTAACDAGKGII